MSEPRYLRTEQQGDVLVVSPLFTFASFTEPDILAEWTAVQDQLRGPGIKHAIVDLGQIPYFGSTVLEWIVQMWKQVKAKGGKLATCSASPIGREVLVASRFDLLWGIFGSREEALEWVGNENQGMGGE